MIRLIKNCRLLSTCFLHVWRNAVLFSLQSWERNDGESREGRGGWEARSCTPLHSLWDLEEDKVGKSRVVGLNVFCTCSFLLVGYNMFDSIPNTHICWPSNLQVSLKSAKTQLSTLRLVELRCSRGGVCIKWHACIVLDLLIVSVLAHTPTHSTIMMLIFHTVNGKWLRTLIFQSRRPTVLNTWEIILSWTYFKDMESGFALLISC